jgi:HNH endonuclease
MKTIQLTKGKSTLVDDDTFEYLNKWKWHYNSRYAERTEDNKHVRMHRLLIGAETGEIVDHINGDPLDNRRSNLRLVTVSQNSMNMRKHTGKSVYKGVSKQGEFWRTQIWSDNERVFSTLTKNERWAGMIYDLNAPALFGEFARLNFPNAVGSEVKTAGALHG